MSWRDLSQKTVEVCDVRFLVEEKKRFGVGVGAHRIQADRVSLIDVDVFFPPNRGPGDRSREEALSEKRL